VKPAIFSALSFHMKRLIITASLISCLSGYAQQPGNNTEPKATFDVLINGRAYQVSENEQLVLDTTLSKPRISIRLADYKKFDNSSLSFDYPRHLSFEFLRDTGYENWTFSGNSLVIMLFELDGKTPLSSLVDEMVKKFGKKNCSVEDFQKELGHKKWNGKKLTVTLAGQKLILDCYEISLNDSKSRFIYFQDSIDQDSHSQEYDEGFKIIDSTIHFK
jgi:hypothetical protein